MDWDPFVGRKVVCTSDGWAAHNGESVPKKGEVYTIRTANPGVDIPDRIFIRLAEIVNESKGYTNGFYECAFDVRGFRPLTQRKTDISVFQKMLEPAPVRVSDYWRRRILLAKPRRESPGAC